MPSATNPRRRWVSSRQCLFWKRLTISRSLTSAFLLLINFFTRSFTVRCRSNRSMPGYPSIAEGWLNLLWKSADISKRQHPFPLSGEASIRLCCPNRTLGNNYIDYVIQGEGERTLPEFSDMLALHGPNLPPVKGVWVKKEGLMTYGGDRDFLDLQTMPAIPYDLVDFNHYIQYYHGKNMCTIRRRAVVRGIADIAIITSSIKEDFAHSRRKKLFQRSKRWRKNIPFF